MVGNLRILNVFEDNVFVDRKFILDKGIEVLLKRNLDIGFYFSK